MQWDLRYFSCRFWIRFIACTQIETNLSFYESTKFETILPNAQFQAGKFVNFGSEFLSNIIYTRFSSFFNPFLVTFNRGKPLPNLLFVPSKCEVMNRENEAQIWKIWDSGYEQDQIGTCNENPSPIGFEMISTPNNPNSKSNAFYGMTYQGWFLNFWCSNLNFQVIEVGTRTKNSNFGKWFRKQLLDSLNAGNRTENPLQAPSHAGIGIKKTIPISVPNWNL